MDHEALKTFLLLADTRNFTKTAEQLHIVQSTVSVRINSLEEELGVALFERTNKQVRLTRQGELYLPYARRIVDLAYESMAHLKTSTFYERYFTVGGLDIIWRCGLHQFLRDYLRDHPRTSLNAITYTSDYINQLLLDGTVDVAFVATPPKSRKFETIPAFSDDVILAASPGLPLSRRPSVAVQELQKLPLLSGNLGGTYKSWFQDVVPSMHNVSINIDITSLIIPFLVDGFGPGLILRSMVERELASGTLVEIPLEGGPLPPRWQTYMIFPTAKKQDPVVQDLASMLQ